MPHRSARPDCLPACALVAALVASVVVAWPAGEMPLVDDWAYAWSVEHLLRTGRLAILDLSSAFPVTQVAWGALLTLPSGFSFTVLRLSTIALCLPGLLAFYFIVRRGHARPSAALAASLTLLWNPVYFVLLCSFMTDVPFLSLATLATLAWVTALAASGAASETAARWPVAASFWAGSALAVGAFLVRQPGIVLPAGLLAYAALARGRRLRRPALVAALVALAVMAAALAAMPLGVGPEGSLAWRAHRLRYVLRVSPWTYLAGILGASYHVGLATFPLALSLPVPRKCWRLAAGGAALLGAGLLSACFGPGFPYPLGPGATWSLEELGRARGLVRGEVGAGATATVLRVLLVGPALFAQVALLGALGERLRQWWRGRMEPPDLLTLVALLYLAMAVALWFFADRYYLPLLPGALLLLAGGLRRVRWATWGALLVVAAVAITGTRDELAYSRALWQGLGWLRARGIALAEIDGGYPANGWLLYAHPENLAPGMHRRRDVPGVTSRERRPYALANTPLPGYRVLREIELGESWWAASRRLYVLGPAAAQGALRRRGTPGGGSSSRVAGS